MLDKKYNNPRENDLNLWQTQFDKCFPNAKVSGLSLNTLFQKLARKTKEEQTGRTIPKQVVG